VFALLIFGVGLVGAGRACGTVRGLFRAQAAGVTTKVVESETDGGAVEPATGFLVIGFGVAPELPEGFDGNLFGAGRVADYARNDSDDPLVALVEEGFKGLIASGHYIYNDGERGVVTGNSTQNNCGKPQTDWSMKVLYSGTRVALAVKRL
jgi:hypothetical protein